MAGLGPTRIVFVGGAPRSGTTVTHALICTGDGVGPYNPEISFLRGMVSSYRLGKGAWELHTNAFFPDQAAFQALMRQTADAWLNAVWEALERPSILAVKDPHLTPLFRALHELYPEEGRFVTVCRHPFDVVRSRQAVHEKSGARTSFGVTEAVEVAREYLGYYQAVLQTNFGGRQFVFRYEDLNGEALRDKLASFVGVPGFHVDRLWETTKRGAGRKALEQSGWASPKYYGPIDLERRLDPIPEDWKAQVRAICAPVMQRMGYE
jgi:hypothetical protein